MKKICLFLLIVSLSVSCVSKKVYGELEDKYNRLRDNNSSLFDENQGLLDTKKELEASSKKLQEELEQLNNDRAKLNDEVARLAERKSKLEKEYDDLSQMSAAQLSEKEKQNRALLLELQEKKEQLAKESTRLEQLQKDLNSRSKRVDELEGWIAAKEAKMQRLKDAVSAALSGFEGKGLSIERKNGKVYVSMENKLLFSSGSWAVGTEGRSAVVNLASVLRQNTDIDVLIEGHTDNVPYAGKGTVADNWDLSTKRATAVARILIGNQVSPKQITAAGRSKYLPVASNASSVGKAKNRRIEIILAPNLDAINQLLNE